MTQSWQGREFDDEDWLDEPNSYDGSPQRRWLSKWVREEGFWNNVTAGVLAAVFFAILLHIWDKAGLFVERPSSRPLLIAFLSFAILAFPLGVIYFFRHQTRRGSGPEVICTLLMGAMLASAFFLHRDGSVTQVAEALLDRVGWAQLEAPGGGNTGGGDGGGIYLPQPPADATAGGSQGGSATETPAPPVINVPGNSPKGG